MESGGGGGSSDGGGCGFSQPTNRSARQVPRVNRAKGPVICQPGATPRDSGQQADRTLKGCRKPSGTPSGCDISRGRADPGRCPGLPWGRAVGASEGCDISRGCADPGRCPGLAWGRAVGASEGCDISRGCVDPGRCPGLTYGRAFSASERIIEGLVVVGHLVAELGRGMIGSAFHHVVEHAGRAIDLHCAGWAGLET